MMRDDDDRGLPPRPRVRSWLSDWKEKILPAKPALPPELAYTFLAQRLAHDVPARKGGRVLALSRICSGTLAAETAMLLASALTGETDGDVVLVDADFITAGLTGQFGLMATPGAAEALLGTAGSPAALSVETAIDRVRLLPCGTVASLPNAISRDAVANFLNALRATSRWVIVVQSVVTEDPRNVPLVAAADVVLILAEETVTRLPEIELVEAMLAANGITDPKLLLARQRATPGSAWRRSA